ncbi:MAG: ABC transporter ATP-binding protein [Geodermatophilaceae bacterium]|nr:ABC transporter ATP-binding protein [Geodermatophilaceae bacterium]
MTLEISRLTSGYGRSSVLQGVDLDVSDGRVLALLGRNGVGKTTLIHTVMGLIRPTGGSISLDGNELSGRRTDQIARAGLALVPQGRRIWPNLDVTEHLALASRQGARRRKGSAGGTTAGAGTSLRSGMEADAGTSFPAGIGSGDGSGSWTIPKILELLPRLGERSKHFGGQLSGGEQQMLAIARALLTCPRVLLMDEPSDGLAPTIVDQIGAVIGTLKSEGVTVLLVEQDLHLAFLVADEIAVMAKGQIAHRCSTADFRADEPTARRLLGVA